VDDRSWFDPKHAIIHFDQNLAPGGYCWTFPKGEKKGVVKRSKCHWLNLILGQSRKSKSERKGQRRWVEWQNRKQIK
jgi:hypothetical protein